MVGGRLTPRGHVDHLRGVGVQVVPPIAHRPHADLKPSLIPPPLEAVHQQVFSARSMRQLGRASSGLVGTGLLDPSGPWP